jgi:hypothetical protein
VKGEEKYARRGLYCGRKVIEARSVTPAEVRKKERRKRVIHPEKTTVERCLLSAILVEAEEGFCVSQTDG